MRLTKNLKAKILQQFKSGASVADCASWYSQQGIRVEQVIRQAMIAADKLDRPVSAAELVAVAPMDRLEERHSHER